MNYLNLNCPPVPYYLTGGIITFDIAEQLQKKKEKTFTLVYVKQGKLALEQETVTAQLDTGDYFIATPDSAYASLSPCAEKTVLYWISFSSSLSYSLSDTCAAYSQPDMAGEQGTASQLFVISIVRHRNIEKHNRFYIEELLMPLISCDNIPKRPKEAFEAKPVRLFELQINFIQLLALLHSHRFSPSLKFNIAERLHDYIDKHFTEDIRLGELAKQYSYSPSHVIRCFNEAYGLSPMQYVKKLRIMKAKRLLGDTELPVQVVAYESGFNVASYFIKQFKKEFGITPTQYRANLDSASEKPMMPF